MLRTQRKVETAVLADSVGKTFSSLSETLTRSKIHEVVREACLRHATRSKIPVGVTPTAWQLLERLRPKRSYAVGFTLRASQRASACGNAKGELNFLKQASELLLRETLREPRSREEVFFPCVGSANLYVYSLSLVITKLRTSLLWSLKLKYQANSPSLFKLT